MKVRALKKFETIRDLERTKIQGKDVYPKEGEVWETSEERAKYLLNHGVIEIVKEVKEEKKDNFKLDDNGNVNIEINTILDGKKIAKQLIAKQLNTITTEEALKDVIPADLEEKPKKTTKKKTTKKEVK